MKPVIFLVIILTLFCGIGSAQTVSPTPEPQVIVSQSFLNDATKAFALVVELRDALEKERTASGATTVVKAALQAQIDALNGLIVIKDRKEAVYQSLLDLRDQAFAVYEKVIKIQADMIERLTTQLNKPQSGWQKFVRIIEKVVIILAGVALGRGF